MCAFLYKWWYSFYKKVLLWKYIISNHFIVIHVGKEIKFVMLQVNTCIFFHKSQIQTSIYSPPSSPVWPSIFFLSFRSGRKCKRLIGCVHSWLCWGWYQMFSFVTRKGYVWNEKITRFCYYAANMYFLTKYYIHYRTRFL